MDYVDIFIFTSNMYKGSIKNFLSALYYDKKKMSKKDIEELKEWFSDK